MTDGPRDPYAYRPTPWRDAETLRELYVDERLTLGECGERLGCSRTTVGAWLDHHGIRREDCHE